MNVVLKVRQATVAHKKFFGDRHEEMAIRQTVEEMSELTTKLMHRLRKRAHSDPLEEMADVMICLEFLKDALGDKADGLGEMLVKKAERFMERVANGSINPPGEEACR